MDRKGANTFPFYNLLPEPKKTSQRFFLCFLTFPQDKIKSRWRLLLNRTSANTNAKPQSVLPPYHTGHDTNDCWALKYKIQNMIDVKEIELDPPETPNVITTPMPNHNQDQINVVEDVDSSNDLNNQISPTATGGSFFIQIFICNFFVCSNNYCHVKFGFPINVLHMCVLN